MQIPTLTQARRALLELMYAQGDTIPPQFAIVSMYLDSLVPLNVENTCKRMITSHPAPDVANQAGINDLAPIDPNPAEKFMFSRPAGGQADMSRSVSMGGGSSAGGMGGGSSAGGMGGGSSAGGMGGGSSAPHGACCSCKECCPRNLPTSKR